MSTGTATAPAPPRPSLTRTSSGATSDATRPRDLARRLLPLQIGVALLAFMLWVPVEKLFMSSIGFTAASIGVMAAAYAATVPLLEIPSGIAADRWSRKWLMILASLALAASSLVGGLSHNVGAYIVAAMLLGIYLAMNSGTVDSMVYDAVLESTGTGVLYASWIGRIRLIESASLVVSALLGGLLAEWTSPRVTYYATVPVALVSIVAFLRFDEPRLHREKRANTLTQHVRTTLRAVTQNPSARTALLLGATASLLGQAIFEFGPLWLTAAAAPPALYGPYWALLVSTIGIGGALATRVRFDRRRVTLAYAALLIAAPTGLALLGHSLPSVIVIQTLMSLLVGILGIRASQLLHDSVASSVRASVASGMGTTSWLLFIPFALSNGWLAREHGMSAAALLFVAAFTALAILMISSTARERLDDRASAIAPSGRQRDRGRDDRAAVVPHPATN